LSPPAAAARYPESAIGPVTYSHIEERPGLHWVRAHDQFGNNVGCAMAPDEPAHIQIHRLPNCECASHTGPVMSK
jgi:hypothetical protein